MSEEIEIALKEAGFTESGDRFTRKNYEPYIIHIYGDNFLYKSVLGNLHTNEDKLLKYLKLFT